MNNNSRHFLVRTGDDNEQIDKTCSFALRLVHTLQGSGMILGSILRPYKYRRK